MFGAERAVATGFDTVPFGTSFVRSEAFKNLFREGMKLVEDTAEYLDDRGRLESAPLGRAAGVAYASESMRLTTRLMQIASWLLVQRAVAEGEITNAQAEREQQRVRLLPQTIGMGQSDFALMPERFRDLVGASLRLHARVTHLDTLLAGAEPAPRRYGNPVGVQRDLLEMAFGARAVTPAPMYSRRG